MSDMYETVWRSGLFNVASIARRQVGSYFVSPIGWVVGAIVIVPVSLFGFLSSLQGNQAMEDVFSVVPFLMVFLVPLYTMRLLSEEKRSGTLEIVLTSPVRDWEVVVGKWLGALLFYSASLLFTGVYVLLIAHFAAPQVPDYGQYLAGYIGLLLAGGMFCAVGLLASSLTENQIIAAMVSLVTLLVLWYLSLASSFAQEPLSSFFQYMGGQDHFTTFTQGQLSLKDVTYFVTITLAALFIAVRVLESRKWR